MKPTFLNKTSLGFGFALSALLIVGYFSYTSIQSLLQAAAQRERIYGIIQEFSILPLMAEEVQNAYRGYLITEQAEFVQSFQQAVTTVDRQFVRLHELAIAEPYYGQQLDSLSHMMRELVHLGEEKMKVRAAQGFNAAQRLAMSESGSRQIESIQKVIAATASQSSELFMELGQVQKARARNAFVIITFGSMLALLFVSLDGLLLHRESVRRRETNAKLKYQAQQLAFQGSIINQVGEAVVAHDRDLRITYWNPAAERLFGWKAEEAMGEKASEFLRSATTPADHERSLARLNEGQTLFGETVVYHKDGRPVEIEVHTIALKNEQGEISGYVNVNRDLTERVRLEEIMRLQSTIVNTVELSQMNTALQAEIAERKRMEEERSELLSRERAARATAEQARAEVEQAKLEVEKELAERKLVEDALGRWASTPLPHETRSVVARYAVAAAVTCLAVLIRLAFDPILGSNLPLPTLFGAVAFAVWYGGIGPALFSVVFGYVVAGWFIVEPRHIMSLDPQDLTGLALYLASSLITIALGETMRRAQRHAHQSAAVAVERQKQVEAQMEERKRAELALRASEHKFSKLFQFAPLAISLQELPEARFVDVSKAFIRLFGYSREELLGKTSLEIGMHADSQTRALALQQLQERGYTRDIEVQITAKSGKPIWVSTNAAVVEIAGKKCLMSTIVDISKRKQMEDEIRRFNIELEELVAERTNEYMQVARELEATNNGLEAAREKLEDEVSERKKAEAEIGKHAARLRILNEFSQTLVASQPDSKLILNTVVQRVAELIGEACTINVLSEDNQWWHQAAVYHPNPELCQFARELATEAPLRADQGLSGRVLQSGEALLVNDISPAQLRSAVSERYWPYFDRYPICCILATPLRMRDRIVGTLVVARYEPENPYTEEDRIVLQELADRTALVLRNAKLFEKVQSEIEERKRAEDQVRLLNEELEMRVEQRTAELHAAMQELETFSYSVSHDLGAPLRGIDGFSQILIEDYGDRLDEEAIGYLQRMRTGAQHMAGLIDALLKLSRMARMQMRPQEVNLSALAAAVAAELREGQPKRQVEIIIGENAVAQGDPQLLRIVLYNLLSNAWKFTNKHSTARIEFGALPSTATENGEPVYYVRDDGAGFDMAYVDKLFGAFQRLHHRTEFDGTGIGLATVQRIIQRHGGKIWAEGKVEEGATFYFTVA